MFEQQKTTLMEILEGSPKQALSRYAEWMISAVVLVNCTAVILDSVPEIHAVHKDFFHELEFWSVMFFTAEYLMRVWSLGAKYAGDAWKGRREYMFSGFGLVDFFATMPYYLHVFFPLLDLRILRVLRLLRILNCPNTTPPCKTCFLRCTQNAGLLALPHFCSPLPPSCRLL